MATNLQLRRATDSELLVRAIAGDYIAYGALVARYRNLVFGVTYHYLKNFEEARDVSQDIFVKAF